MSEMFKYKSILAPFMNRLVEIKTSAGVSALRMKWILKEIDDFAFAEGLENPHITSDFISKWRSGRKADCGRTIYSKYSVWSQLTKLMTRTGCPCFIPRLPRQPDGDFVPYIFTEEQMSAIFKACDESRLYDIRCGTVLFAMPAMIRLLYSTGMRVSEALSVRNADINIDEGYIHLRKTKNGMERLVPLCDSMSAVLQQYITYRNRMPVAYISDPKNLLFIKPDGTGITQGSVYTNFKKLLDKVGIPHKGSHHGPRVHDLRHTSAVHALVMTGRQGMDLYAALPLLSARLGHASVSSTEQYVRLTTSMFPELEKQCTPVSAFVYPKFCKAYDDSDRICQIP